MTGDRMTGDRVGGGVGESDSKLLVGKVVVSLTVGLFVGF